MVVGCTPVNKLSPASVSLLQQAEKTYQHGQPAKLELCGPAIQLGVGLYMQGRYAAVITAFVTAMLTYNFDIKCCVLLSTCCDGEGESASVKVDAV